MSGHPAVKGDCNFRKDGLNGITAHQCRVEFRGKRRSRFPEGMTERKAKAKAD
jgi:hypothetical protein